MRTLLPAGWPRPRGYSQACAARGETLFIAGQVGWDTDGRMAGPGFVDQAAQALRNIVAILACAGARPTDLVRLTWYVTDRHEYLGQGEPLGQVYREIIGRHYPAMSVVEVSGLIETGARLEIEATAVVAAH